MNSRFTRAGHHRENAAESPYYDNLSAIRFLDTRLQIYLSQFIAGVIAGQSTNRSENSDAIIMPRDARMRASTVQQKFNGQTKF